MKRENQPVKVLFAASEADPFFKVGGLGDYAGSLPAAVHEHFENKNIANDVRVVLPLHDPAIIEPYSLQKLFEIRLENTEVENFCVVYEGNYSGLIHYFIRQISPEPESPAVYGHDQYQTAYKFALFSIMALRMLKELDWSPDIVHTNDWHTALINHLVKNRIVPLKKQPKTLLAIHNMPFMGYGSEPVYSGFGIKAAKEATFPAWAENLPLPMGIKSADRIVAVSPTYAQELTTNYFAYGLEGYFLKHPEKITGIINGIDYEKWNPAVDEDLYQPFSLVSLDDRRINKIKLYEEIGFNFDPHTPLLIVISRLENQKGIDLILDGLSATADLDWKAVILGSGHHGYEYAFRALERVFPDKIHAVMEYNPNFAKKLYAAGDIILMPSLYEPCGLSQMIAMRYGCVPVAHAVGGLKDSITTSPEEKRTGFLFEPAAKEHFISSIKQALSAFSNAEKWKEIQINGMNENFSWNQSAARYADLYIQLINENKNNP